MTVYLVYGATEYEGLGYPSVHANYESALSTALEQVRNYLYTDHHALSVRVDSFGTVEFVELLDMNFDHPERGFDWSGIHSICISEEEVKGS